MPKFRIASRGGSTLTKIDATLKGTYSGIVDGKTITQNAFREIKFIDGVANLMGYDPLDPVGGLTAASSLMLTIGADIPKNQEFYVSTTLQYKLTKVKFIDPKSGKEGFILEGLPDAVTIVLTEVPRTKEQEAERVISISSTIIASAVLKVKK